MPCARTDQVCEFFGLNISYSDFPLAEAYHGPGEIEYHLSYLLSAIPPDPRSAVEHSCPYRYTLIQSSGLPNDS